jgi:transcriptional regulator with XRE-family HTH domain
MPAYVKIDLQKVGSRLADERVKRGLRQVDVAAAVDTSQTTWSNIEDGKRRILDGVLIGRFCSIYKVSADYILFGPKGGAHGRAAPKSGSEGESRRVQQFATA